VHVCMWLVCIVCNIASRSCVPCGTLHVASVYHMEQSMWLVLTKWIRTCGWCLPSGRGKVADVYQVEQRMELVCTVPCGGLHDACVFLVEHCI
jgi:hypothetical protein